MEMMSAKIATDSCCLHVVNVYNPPGKKIAVTEARRVFQKQPSSLVMGDFNAWSELWQCRPSDQTGSLIADTAERTGHIVMNTKTPTKDNDQGEDTILDLTFATYSNNNNYRSRQQ